MIGMPRGICRRPIGTTITVIIVVDVVVIKRCVCFDCLPTGGSRSRPRGDDAHCSPGEDRVRHLRGVRLLLDPVRRRAALRQLGHPAAVRSPLHVHDSTPARQSQFRHLRPDEPQRALRLRGVSDDAAEPSDAEPVRDVRQLCRRKYARTRTEVCVRTTRVRRPSASIGRVLTAAGHRRRPQKRPAL